MDVVAAPISLNGKNVCITSGDSSGLFKDVDPSAALTRNLENVSNFIVIIYHY